MKIIIPLLVFLIIPVALSEECKTTLCYDFKSICCGENIFPAKNMEVTLRDYTPKTRNEPMACPDALDVARCEIQIYNPGSTTHADKYWIGFGPCSVKNEIQSGIIQRWTCPPETQYSLKGKEYSTTIVLQRGEKVYGTSNEDNKITVARIAQRVLTVGGEGIDGTEGCILDPSKYYKVYDRNELEVSGNVALDDGECYSFAKNKSRECGKICQECFADIDCIGSDDLVVNYSGRTLGAVCENRQIMLKGCNETGDRICLEKEIMPDGEENCRSSEAKKECKTIRRIATECCSSSDCSEGEICQWITDTESECVKKAQCQKDSDCGRKRCSFKKIIEPFCNAEKQCEERILQNVSCCSDFDCNDGSFCTIDNECKQMTQQKQQTVAMQQRPEEEQTENEIFEEKTDIDTITGDATKVHESKNPAIIVTIILIVVISATLAGYFFIKDMIEKKDSANKPLSSNFCVQCGNQIDKDDKFCTECGIRLKT